MIEELDFSSVPSEVLINFTMRTILDVKNPRWVRADNSLLDVDVLFQELESMGYIGFTTMENADTDHGVEIWTKANAGDYGPIAPYVAPIVLPSDVQLTPDQFYTMLEVDFELLELFEATIETVTPLSKKLTCRNQFNNSSTFTWDMTLMTIVAPLVWGVDWQTTIGDAWVNAGS